MRIILAARDTDLRLAMQLLLSEEPGVRVIGSASNASGLLALIDSTTPDLVLMDEDLPGKTILELLTEIAACKAPPKIVLLGAETSMSNDFAQTGVKYYIQKGDPPEELVNKFRRAVFNHEMNDQNRGKEKTKS
jgi:DNA-binding NarL/FixJ family response regulator